MKVRKKRKQLMKKDGDNGGKRETTRTKEKMENPGQRKGKGRKVRRKE